MGMKSTRISTLLSGAPNDAEVLRTSLCFAAREGCDLHVVLADSFPKGTFLRKLDVAMWEVSKRGLPPPQVSVERHHRTAESVPRVSAG